MKSEPKSLEVWKTSLKKMDEAFAKFREAQATLDHHGFNSYHMEKLLKYSEALFNNYAPLWVGDRVVLTEDLCAGWDPPGWQHVKQDLKVGATGTIVNIDYTDHGWEVDFAPDVNTWIDPIDGTRKPSKEKRMFRCSASKMKELT